MSYKIKFLDGSTKEFYSLVGANLSGADLFGTNLSGANLFGANLIGANLSYCTGIVTFRI
jgi:uncharacterized protein YjbI with pentapeptide repeats